MPEFRIIDTEPVHYLFVEGESPTDPQAVSEAMGAAFGEVMGFMGQHGVPPAGPPMSVYYGYDAAKMRFRAGVAVTADDARAASGRVRTDATPGGRVVHFFHVGPYAKLHDSYGALMAHCEAEGLTLSAPTWEVYVDDPGEVPEERMRTEIFVSIE